MKVRWRMEGVVSTTDGVYLRVTYVLHEFAQRASCTEDQRYALEVAIEGMTQLWRYLPTTLGKIGQTVERDGGYRKKPG
mgnify:CR=1 FL=1